MTIEPVRKRAEVPRTDRGEARGTAALAAMRELQRHGKKR
jgi:hypothetical protein